MYLNNVGLVPIPDYPDLWYLDGDLVWQHPTGIKITAPKGLITDDASIPKVLDWISFLDRAGRSRRPGLTHDALYSLGREKGKDFADLSLRWACIDEGMTGEQAKLIYDGVHDFGQSAYDADRGNGHFGIIKIGNFFGAENYENWKLKGQTVFS